eukprot:gnl/TRDRNA2_/TRDRNA2_184629_c0_seq1.p1 gnl/TRDRNA2_/TRDRNA2_184629_c0~~gnl/TRDRNA2_/TRDRNA2_184629_c0_seq1.p1  ORF type:complete len:1281 (+),score=241.08 gnl/TRDRNA2_/TRDRNA2_184629_c0_seq1:554-3844(+)
MSQAGIRSVRHAATVAALAVAEALGAQHQNLARNRDTLQRQMEALQGGRRNMKQAAKLESDTASTKSQAEQLENARTEILEGTVPLRCRDVSEVIRLHTLCEVERLMKQDPEMYMQNKWTARVFLMIHDPSVEVRLKALNVIHYWYTNANKRSEKVQEHLNHFAQRTLSHLVERVSDVDAKVATAAARCLRVPSLAERLEDEEFDLVVNLCIGSRDPVTREESALFINSHVFQSPGICTQAPTQKRRGGDKGEDDGADRDVDADVDGEARDQTEANKTDTVVELYNSETSLSMLVEYLENYVGDHLRISERAVNAFWARTPALAHWSTMVNLCLVGESSRSVGVDPITPKQRLCLLYIMEAAVRRADEDSKPDSKGAKSGEISAALAKLTDACTHILPELPRLFELCRSEEHQSLLLSHICKILVEFAVENASQQVLVNAKALCTVLRKAIAEQGSLDTTRYCTDALLALARCFDEAKAAFLDLAKAVHHSCEELLKPESVSHRLEELRLMMGRFVVMCNRGIDMTFGNIDMLERIIALLKSRSKWMQEWQVAKALAEGDAEPACEAPAGAPGVCLTLQLLESAVVAVMWHVRMAFWIESAGGSKAEKKGDASANSDHPTDASTAEAQVSEMLQDVTEVSTLRAKLPRAVSRLRSVLCEVVDSDRSPYCRFHAFSGYLSLLQLAVGVSEKLSLEESCRVEATDYGSWYETVLPEGDMKVLWQYLNSLYVRLSDDERAKATFEPDGQHIQAVDVFPAPSQGTLTSARFLIQSQMEKSHDTEESFNISSELELLFGVLASRMVAEIEMDDVYAGPLGHLVLTQCERSRPKPLRDVGLRLLKRLREMAKTNSELAIQYFRMQEETIIALFESAGIGAASAISAEFTKQRGPQNLPWLERPLFVVLREGVVGCITEDKHRLPLLEVFAAWISREDFMAEAQRKELAADVMQQCGIVGLSGEQEGLITKFLRRVLPPAPPPAPTPSPVPPPAAPAERSPPPAPAPTSASPPAGSPPVDSEPQSTPASTRRIIGKRAVDSPATPADVPMPAPANTSFASPSPTGEAGASANRKISGKRPMLEPSPAASAAVASVSSKKSRRS